jgi:hydrogenase expression/formation protein HypE
MDGGRVNKPVKAGYSRPLDIKHGRVDLTHGSGGRAMAQLIEQLFAPAFDNALLAQGNDGTVLTLPPGRVVMATDSHVVSPLFFPGGDIGALSVHGTVNDLAVMGATPLYLSAGFILEEGFPLADLKRIVESMAAAARAAGVQIVTGDTKVVEQGKGDGVFINTTGIGVLPESMPAAAQPGGTRARAGDKIIVSGSIGDHGMAIMSLRESLAFGTEIVSDSAALHGLIAEVLSAVHEHTLRDPQRGVHVLRDPTRGGVATTLNEIARQSGVGMMLDEAAIPVRPQVAAACEFLGLDPLYVANEGKVIAVVAAEDTAAVLAAMRAHALGADAAVIGDVIADEHQFVQMKTRFGGRRIVDWLSGDQLPRIC